MIGYGQEPDLAFGGHHFADLLSEYSRPFFASTKAGINTISASAERGELVNHRRIESRRVGQPAFCGNRDYGEFPDRPFGPFSGWQQVCGHR